MKRDKLFAAVLVLAAVAALYVLLRSVSSGQKQAAASSGAVPEVVVSPTQHIAAQPISQPDRVVVYYFHGNRRCRSCLKMEELAASAVRSGFSQELASGRVEWKTVNIDLAQNEHFVWRYNLSFRAVVLSRQVSGQEKEWKLLDGVWHLLNSPG
ncbi:MAG TPA: nitrophenyl compound nitroreductase subunit ArsF family protein, partial [Oligoflexia bacterium]|nr:nitrophenyl compound nitroreductase subunit ArsF family protein [Oligoflexia bacterium]